MSAGKFLKNFNGCIGRWDLLCNHSDQLTYDLVNRAGQLESCRAAKLDLPWFEDMKPALERNLLEQIDEIAFKIRQQIIVELRKQREKMHQAISEFTRTLKDPSLLERFLEGTATMPSYSTVLLMYKGILDVAIRQLNEKENALSDPDFHSRPGEVTDNIRSVFSQHKSLTGLSAEIRELCRFESEGG